MNSGLSAYGGNLNYSGYSGCCVLAPAIVLCQSQTPQFPQQQCFRQPQYQPQMNCSYQFTNCRQPASCLPAQQCNYQVQLHQKPKIIYRPYLPYCRKTRRGYPLW